MQSGITLILFHPQTETMATQKKKKSFDRFDFFCRRLYSAAFDVWFGERVLILAQDQKTDGRNWFPLTCNTPGFYTVTFIFQEFSNKHLELGIFYEELAKLFFFFFFFLPGWE